MPEFDPVLKYLTARKVQLLDYFAAHAAQRGINFGILGVIAVTLATVWFGWRGVEYVAVACCGAGLGATELLSRYRDAPFTTLSQRWALYYLAINAVLAVVCLVLVQTIASGIVPESHGDGLKKAIYEVLIAGFGGAIFFRSAIVRSKIGGEDFGVGPSFVIDTLLAVTDRQVDRQRGIDRIDYGKLVDGLSLAIIQDVIAPYAMNLLQNLSAKEREDLTTQMSALNTAKVDEDLKPLITSQMIINLVGSDVLAKAIKALDPIIQKKKKEAPKVPAKEAVADAIKQQRAASGTSGKPSEDVSHSDEQK
jgi:hypothetical protein